MESWLFFQDESHAPDWNMACDEWLLTQISNLKKPLLRVYGWTCPSITLGYFQKFSEICHTGHIAVRRPTGGALVVHGHDLTFTVVLPQNHAWCQLAILDRYHRIHERVAQIFIARGQHAELASREPSHLPSKNRGSHGMQCFVGHSKYDVIVHGHKVAGGAQRFCKDGLLHQGSIQGPGITQKVSVEELKKAWEFWDIEWINWNLSAKDLIEIQSWVDCKYSTTDWKQEG